MEYKKFNKSEIKQIEDLQTAIKESDWNKFKITLNSIKNTNRVLNPHRFGYKTHNLLRWAMKYKNPFMAKILLGSGADIDISIFHFLDEMPEIRFLSIYVKHYNPIHNSAIAHSLLLGYKVEDILRVFKDTKYSLTEPFTIDKVNADSYQVNIINLIDEINQDHVTLRPIHIAILRHENELAKHLAEKPLNLYSDTFNKSEEIATNILILCMHCNNKDVFNNLIEKQYLPQLVLDDSLGYAIRKNLVHYTKILIDKGAQVPDDALDHLSKNSAKVPSILDVLTNHGIALKKDQYHEFEHVPIGYQSILFKPTLYNIREYLDKYASKHTGKNFEIQKELFLKLFTDFIATAKTSLKIDAKDKKLLKILSGHIKTVTKKHKNNTHMLSYIKLLTELNQYVTKHPKDLINQTKALHNDLLTKYQLKTVKLTEIEKSLYDSIVGSFAA